MREPLREIARGIGFTEGPVWLGGGRIAVTSTSRGEIVTLMLDATPDTAVESRVETGGGPNGIARFPDGRLAVLQNATFRSRSTRPVVSGIQLIADGRVTAVDIPDSAAPNDGAFDRNGALWYTDPGRDDARHLGPRTRRWDPASGEVSTVADDVAFPNGIAFSPAGDELYLADSHGHRIVRYSVHGDALASPTTFADIPGTEPDGIAFDRAGNLYIAAFGSDEVVVLDPSGAVTQRIPTGEGSRPTNLCFAGESLETLVVTLASGGRVVALDDAFEGLEL